MAARGELISGRTINEHLQVYGRTHDEEIWRDFEANNDILNIQDARAFYEASGVRPK